MSKYFPDTRIDTMSDDELASMLSEDGEGIYDIQNSALGIISDVLSPGCGGPRRHTSTHERYLFLTNENDGVSIIGIIEE